MDQTEKLPYREPAIVTIGDAVALTGAVGTPVRDNPDSLGPPAWYNANPRQRTEVELDD
jgi:hypothetical protein